MNRNFNGWYGPKAAIESTPRLSGVDSDLSMNGRYDNTAGPFSLNGTDPADLKYTTMQLAGAGIGALLIGLGAGFYFFGKKNK